MQVALIRKYWGCKGNHRNPTSPKRIVLWDLYAHTYMPSVRYTRTEEINTSWHSGPGQRLARGEERWRWLWQSHWLWAKQALFLEKLNPFQCLIHLGLLMSLHYCHRHPDPVENTALPEHSHSKPDICRTIEFNTLISLTLSITL